MIEQSQDHTFIDSISQISVLSFRRRRRCPRSRRLSRCFLTTLIEHLLFAGATNGVEVIDIDFIGVANFSTLWCLHKTSSQMQSAKGSPVRDSNEVLRIHCQSLLFRMLWSQHFKLMIFRCIVHNIRTILIQSQSRIHSSQTHLSRELVQNGVPLPDPHRIGTPWSCLLAQSLDGLILKIFTGSARCENSIHPDLYLGDDLPSRPHVLFAGRHANHPPAKIRALLLLKPCHRCDRRQPVAGRMPRKEVSQWIRQK